MELLSNTTFQDNDPTLGFVDYQSQGSAKNKGLTKYDTSKKGSYMGVDFATTYPTEQTASNRGRASVRIESKKKYTHALVIANIGHMPDNVCGTWPAFWSVSHDNYPQWGEIDMLENINEETQSLNVLHTSPGCTVAGNQGGVARQSGNQASYNCDDLAQSSPYGSQSQCKKDLSTRNYHSRWSLRARALAERLCGIRYTVLAS